MFSSQQGTYCEIDLQEAVNVYANPHTPPPVKVSELSAYIEKRKAEVNGFKKEFQVTHYHYMYDILVKKRKKITALKKGKKKIMYIEIP